MSAIKLVIIDQDEKYLMPLERKFIQEMGYTCDLVIISDINYLMTFFSVPQTIDVLLIQEDLYDKTMERHDIGHIYLLTEKMEDQPVTLDLTMEKIYKYTSVHQIYQMVVNDLPKKIQSSRKKKNQTKVLTVYSPIGGVGKTTVAMGLASAMQKQFKKVLYIGIDNLQTFGYYLDPGVSLKGDIERKFVNRTLNQYESMMPYLMREPFGIVPPFAKALSLIDVTVEDYIRFIETVRETKDYDYIIVDTASDFTHGITKLMGISDHVLLIIGQEASDAYKVERIIDNIDCSNESQFSFFCNQHRPDKANVWVEERFSKRFQVKQYIPYSEEIEKMAMEDLGAIQSFIEIANLYTGNNATE